MSTLTWIDWTVIGGYFALLFGLAWWVILQNRDTADDYFLAGRNLSWWIVGGSIFASNIGSEHLVGLAGSGATDGVAMAHYELHAWCLLVLAWVLVPFYMRSQGLHDARVSGAAFQSDQPLGAVAHHAGRLRRHEAGRGHLCRWRRVRGVVAGHGARLALDSFWMGSILVVVLTGVYTILGGLRAVAYTEAMQTGVLVIGSAWCAYGWCTGGWHQLVPACGPRGRGGFQAEAMDSRASRRVGTSAGDLRVGDVQPVEAMSRVQRPALVKETVRWKRRRRQGSRDAWRGTSTTTIRGSACCSARR